jgi:predicted GNAT family acetyltransferase
MDRQAVQIADVPPANRYEARRGDELVGFIDYRRVNGRLALIHTEVPPAFEGQGIAGAMARFVLEGARSRHDRVTIRCPYLRTYIERHPELAPADDGRIPLAGDG